jgi:hypothetical protein
MYRLFCSVILGLGPKEDLETFQNALSFLLQTFNSNAKDVIANNSLAQRLFTFLGCRVAQTRQLHAVRHVAFLGSQSLALALRTDLSILTSSAVTDLHFMTCSARPAPLQG